MPMRWSKSPRSSQQPMVATRVLERRLEAMVDDLPPAERDGGRRLAQRVRSYWRRTARRCSSRCPAGRWWRLDRSQAAEPSAGAARSSARSASRRPGPPEDRSRCVAAHREDGAAQGWHADQDAAAIHLVAQDEVRDRQARGSDPEHLIIDRGPERLSPAHAVTDAAHLAANQPRDCRGDGLRPLAARIEQGNHRPVWLDRRLDQDGRIVGRTIQGEQLEAGRSCRQPGGDIGLFSFHHDQPIAGHVQHDPRGRVQMLGAEDAADTATSTNGGGAVMATTLLSVKAWS